MSLGAKDDIYCSKLLRQVKNMTSETNKKSKLRSIGKRIVLLSGIGVGGIFLTLLILFMVQFIIPYTKTNFKSYEAFREKTHNYYPDELPASASEIKYYYYNGKFDNFSAVAFTVNAQDFANLRERYTIYFKQFRFNSSYGSARYENQTIPENFLKEETVEFLNDMMD